jgi:hypothetical protein
MEEKKAQEKIKRGLQSNTFLNFVILGCHSRKYQGIQSKP